MSTFSMEPRRPAGRSPFDAIRHTDTDPAAGEFEWWEAREMMPFLGYERWESFREAIERAKIACRINGYDVGHHFRDAPKMIGIGKGGLRQIEDVQMTRCACYFVAMSGDPRKPQVARALEYFALQTFRAEQLLSPPQPPASPPVQAEEPWATRFRRTYGPHVRDLNLKHPGCFSVVSAVVAEILSIEDQIVRHQMTTRSFDRPDISIGKTYALHRRAMGLHESPLTAELYLPDQDITVEVKVYDGDEWKFFATWFRGVYLTEKLPPYLHRKPELKSYLPLVRASAADNACRELAGRPATLPPAQRSSLDAAGGFVPARQLPPSSPPPRIGA